MSVLSKIVETMSIQRQFCTGIINNFSDAYKRNVKSMTYYATEVGKKKGKPPVFVATFVSGETQSHVTPEAIVAAFTLAGVTYAHVEKRAFKMIVNGVETNYPTSNKNEYAGQQEIIAKLADILQRYKKEAKG